MTQDENVILAGAQAPAPPLPIIPDAPALLAEGMSIRDIAEETGISKSTVHRLEKRLERDTSNDPGGTAKVEQEQ